jgi:predicted nucleic-acid-binding protein
MRAIDTNVLVRLLIGDDEAQVAAAESFVTGGAWASHVVLVEAIWVLKSVYEVPQAQLMIAIEMLLDHDVVALQDPDVVAAALALFRKQPKLGFSDCLVLEIAKKAGHTPLGTFDRGFAKQPGAERVLQAGQGGR